MRIAAFPLARITFCFVAGIWVAFYLEREPKQILPVLFVFSIIMAAIWSVARNKPRFTLAFGILAAAFAMMLGIATQTLHNEEFQPNHYIHKCTDAEQVHEYVATLRERLKSTAKNECYIADMITMDGKKSSGKILLNIRRHNRFLPLMIGSRLKIKSQIFKNGGIYNPNQFDYGQYLSRKSVFAQSYPDGNALQIYSKPDLTIWYFAAKFRQRIIHNLEQKHFKKEELHVVTALLLGQQQEISKETLKDYQFAGAVHVLSVSGLHVGFILCFIQFGMSRLPKTRRYNLLRFLVVLISLWGFALVAGMSPSVVRSVTMFSFVAMGLFLNRETNIFHTLLVSMLLILLVAPSFLFDVGFQLSYLSLFFILWLQPVFARFWKPKNKIALYCWNILLVSTAAQLGAFPLSIYYFHQFAGLFFLTNLLILPGLGVIMGLGLVVILLALVNYLPQWIVNCLEYSILVLNSCIKWIASMDRFILKDIPMTVTILACLYVLIIAWGMWLENPNFRKFRIGLLSILVLQSAYFYNFYKTQTESEWIVFHERKHTLLAARTGNSIVFQTNAKGDPYSDASANDYYIAHFGKNRQTKALQNLVYFDRNKILILDSTAVFPQKTDPDIVLLTQSPKINMDRFLKLTRPVMVIADGSNYKSYVKRWKQSCAQQKIPFHATAEKGFYKLE